MGTFPARRNAGPELPTAGGSKGVERRAKRPDGPQGLPRLERVFEARAGELRTDVLCGLLATAPQRERLVLGDCVPIK